MGLAMARLRVGLMRTLSLMNPGSYMSDKQKMFRLQGGISINCATSDYGSIRCYC